MNINFNVDRFARFFDLFGMISKTSLNSWIHLFLVYGFYWKMWHTMDSSFLSALVYFILLRVTKSNNLEQGLKLFSRGRHKNVFFLVACPNFFTAKQKAICNYNSHKGTEFSLLKWHLCREMCLRFYYFAVACIFTHNLTWKGLSEKSIIYFYIIIGFFHFWK